jgi:hypothetical protein
MRKLVLLLLLLSVGALAHKHSCIHEKISQKFQPHQEQLTDEEKQHRLLQYTTVRPIKIVIDDSNMASVTAQERDLIIGKLVPVATKFLERRLSVLTRGSPIKVPFTTCYEVIIKRIYLLRNIL